MRGDREKGEWRRREVLGSSWEDNLRDLLREGPIDLICLTGDVADWGKPAEYEEAQAFVAALLARAQLPKERFFVVPGNHDIDRSVSTSAWRALRRHLPQADGDAASRWLADGGRLAVRSLAAKQRREIWLRQGAYQDWVSQRLGRPELLPANSPHQLMGYRVQVEGLPVPFPVWLIGLDSAWLAGDDSDAGKLRLTADQIMRLATREGNPLPGLRIALVHHPLHELADHEESQRRLAGRVDLLLRGHLHEQDVLAERRPHSQLLQLAAGCLYEGGKGNSYPNSCQVVTLTLDETGTIQELDLHLRAWSPRGHWHDDASRYPQAPGGRLRCSRTGTGDSESWTFQRATSLPPTEGPRAGAAPKPAGGLIAGPESLLHGMGTLTAGPLVRSFLQAYLGSAEHPEPFGGRSEALRALRSWFDAPGPPALVLSAPAGCGKSALLCHFCIEMLGRRDVAVAYFPISIRYQTGLENRCLPALVSRLGFLYGDRPHNPAHTTTEQWRLLLDQYLSRSLPGGRQLLVILDGLDETTGWSFDRTLLPTRPAPGVRILVAARSRVGEVGYDGWRHALGWASPQVSIGMSLEALDVDGVAEAIASLGMPLDRVAQRSELVVQIHRLSRGEPLLVQLWCRRLWQEGDQALTLTPAQLERYPPGLKGYLQEFWESRKPEEKSALRDRASAQQVLETLASALGPLSREDLLALLPELRTLDMLKQAMEPLARFVAGDGREQGFVLRHSLLRDHFREEEMSAAQRRERDLRFLSYGDQTLSGLASGSLRPEQVSPYLLQYLGDHISNGCEEPDERAAKLMALVQNPWRLAWEHLDHGFGGFLHDVDRVWEAGRAADAQRAAGEIPPLSLAARLRCALCVAAERTRSNRMPEALFIQLLSEGIWSTQQALAFVQQLHHGMPGKDLGRALFHVLSPKLPDDLLRRALDIAVALATSDWGNEGPLLSLYARAAKVCRHEVIAAVRGLSKPYLRMTQLAALAQHLPPELCAELRREALALAESFPQAADRCSAMRELADSAAKGERSRLLLESLQHGTGIEDPARRAHEMQMLIPKLTLRHRKKALAIMLNTVPFFDQSHQVLYLMESLSHFNDLTQIQVIKRIYAVPTGPDVVHAWLTQLPQPSQSGQPTAPDSFAKKLLLIQQAIGPDVVNSLIRTHLMAQIFSDTHTALHGIRIVEQSLSQNTWQELFTQLRQVAPEWALTTALCRFGHHISLEYSIEGLNRLLRQEWQSEGHGHIVLQTAYSRLPPDRQKQALALVAASPFASTRAWASAALAGFLEGSAQADLLWQAALAAREIPTAKQRAECLLRLWYQLGPEHQTDVLSWGIESVAQLRSASAQMDLLRDVARNLANPYCDKFVRYLHSLIPQLTKSFEAYSRAESLLRIPQVSDDLKAELFQSALRYMRDSGRSSAHELVDLSEYAQGEQRRDLLFDALTASRRLSLQERFLRTSFVLRPTAACQHRLLALCATLETEQKCHLLAYCALPHLQADLRVPALRQFLEVVRQAPAAKPSRLRELGLLLEQAPIELAAELRAEALAVALKLLRLHAPQLRDLSSQAEDEDYDRSHMEVARALRETLPQLLRPIATLAEQQEFSDLLPDHWHECQAALLRFEGREVAEKRLQAILNRLSALSNDKRAIPLAEVAVQLDGEQRVMAIHQAMALARRTRQGGNSSLDTRPVVLSLVAPYLDAGHVPEFTRHFVGTCRDGSPGTNLPHLISRLPESFRATIVDAWLADLAEWPAQVQQAARLAIADRLPVDEFVARIIPILTGFVQPQHKSVIASALPRLPEPTLCTLFDTIKLANAPFAPSDGQAIVLAAVGSELLRRSRKYLVELGLAVDSALRRSVADNLERLLTTLQHLAPVLEAMVGGLGIDAMVAELLALSDWWDLAPGPPGQSRYAPPPQRESLH